MQTTLVLTVISLDRTGQVESLARTVASHGGNWIEVGFLSESAGL